MSDKKGLGAQKYFVTKSGLGYEAGIYTLEEIKDLPNAARPHIISIGVAESMGYVVLDHNSGKEVNELTAFAGVDFETGKQLKLRGVAEGTIDNPKSVKTDTVTGKIGNSLRDKLQDMKQKSAEESLKAKIEAKKKELNK